MASFKAYYRALFKSLGYPLGEREAMSADAITAAEKALGIRVPRALRDYYLVAGRERRFNVCNHRMLSPSDWFVDKQRLIFMEENQWVVWWAVPVRDLVADDPLVTQGMNDEPIAWQSLRRKCSEFLTFMLHYQAVCGGFRCRGRAELPDGYAYQFDKEGWSDRGELLGVQAYSRPNQVVCLESPGGAPFMQRWSAVAGAKSKKDLRAISIDLDVEIT